MKKIVFLLLVVFGLQGFTKAQETTKERKAISNKFAIGYQVGQYQRDFVFGGNITSPYFFRDRVAFRLKGNIALNDNVRNNETKRSTYSNLSLGLVLVGGKINNSIKLYGEGALLGLFPSDEFSSKDFEFGVYGLFGFEFYIHHKLSYFIEIGGTATQSTADLVENKPIYSNGFLINAGLRLHLGKN